jgi:aspartate/methionine/tyrosine aminotransferase
MADFRHLGRGDDDMAFAYWLIDEVDVATVPGSSSTLPLLFWAAVWCVSLSKKGRNARHR